MNSFASHEEQSKDRFATPFGFHSARRVDWMDHFIPRSVLHLRRLSGRTASYDLR